MSESVEEIVRLIVSRLEGEMAHGYHATDLCRDLNSLIADWRKRGEALERMRELAEERSLVQSIRLKGLEPPR